MSPEKEIAKAAFASVENEAKEKQIQEVKRIVVKTLERLEAVKKEIKELQEKERVLKMDIEDLKEGRLDLIAERQEKDSEAKKISVVLIIKEKEYVPVSAPSPWYWPYTVVWPSIVPPVFAPAITCQNNFAINGTCASIDNSVLTTTAGGTNCVLSDVEVTIPTCINNSVAKYATVGSYEVNGHIVNLR